MGGPLRPHHGAWWPSMPMLGLRIVLPLYRHPYPRTPHCRASRRPHSWPRPCYRLPIPCTHARGCHAHHPRTYHPHPHARQLDREFLSIFNHLFFLSLPSALTPPTSMIRCKPCAHESSDNSLHHNPLFTCRTYRLHTVSLRGQRVHHSLILQQLLLLLLSHFKLNLLLLTHPPFPF